MPHDTDEQMPPDALHASPAGGELFSHPAHATTAATTAATGRGANRERIARWCTGPAPPASPHDTQGRLGEIRAKSASTAGR